MAHERTPPCPPKVTDLGQLVLWILAQAERLAWLGRSEEELYLEELAIYREDPGFDTNRAEILQALLGTLPASTRMEAKKAFEECPTREVAARWKARARHADHLRELDGVGTQHAGSTLGHMWLLLEKALDPSAVVVARTATGVVLTRLDLHVLSARQALAKVFREEKRLHRPLPDERIRAITEARLYLTDAKRERVRSFDAVQTVANGKPLTPQSRADHLLRILDFSSAERLRLAARVARRRPALAMFVDCGAQQDLSGTPELLEAAITGATSSRAATLLPFAARVLFEGDEQLQRDVRRACERFERRSDRLEFLEACTRHGVSPDDAAAELRKAIGKIEQPAPKGKMR